MDQSSFKSSKLFLCRDVFPYGLARSGEFTIEQAKLLEAHGFAYLALADGSATPINSEEEAFVAFCKGDKEADNKHEKAWRRYVDRVQKVNKGHFSVGLGSNDVSYSSHNRDD